MPAVVVINELRSESVHARFMDVMGRAFIFKKVILEHPLNGFIVMLCMLCNHNRQCIGSMKRAFTYSVLTILRLACSEFHAN